MPSLPSFTKDVTKTNLLIGTLNAALRCEQRLAILDRSETAKRCESLLNALLCNSYNSKTVASS